MPTTNSDRIRNYRKRQTAQGLTAVTLWLDRETIERLEPHIAPYGEYLSHAVARVLKEYAPKFKRCYAK